MPRLESQAAALTYRAVTKHYNWTVTNTIPEWNKTGTKVKPQILLKTITRAYSYTIIQSTRICKDNVRPACVASSSFYLNSLSDSLDSARVIISSIVCSTIVLFILSLSCWYDSIQMVCPSFLIICVPLLNLLPPTHSHNSTNSYYT